jgi:hypothetical protein
MEPYILLPSFAASIRFISSNCPVSPTKLGLVAVSHGKLEPRPQYLTMRLRRMRRSLCASEGHAFTASTGRANELLDWIASLVSILHSHQ